VHDLEVLALDHGRDARRGRQVAEVPGERVQAAARGPQDFERAADHHGGTPQRPRRKRAPCRGRERRSDRARERDERGVLRLMNARDPAQREHAHAHPARDQPMHLVLDERGHRRERGRDVRHGFHARPS